MERSATCKSSFAKQIFYRGNYVGLQGWTFIPRGNGHPFVNPQGLTLSTVQKNGEANRGSSPLRANLIPMGQSSPPGAKFGPIGEVGSYGWTFSPTGDAILRGEDPLFVPLKGRVCSRLGMNEGANILRSPRFKKLHSGTDVKILDISAVTVYVVL
jgi:hypothetical protein